MRENSKLLNETRFEFQFAVYFSLVFVCLPNLCVCIHKHSDTVARIHCCRCHNRRQERGNCFCAHSYNYLLCLLRDLINFFLKFFLLFIFIIHSSIESIYTLSLGVVLKRLTVHSLKLWYWLIVCITTEFFSSSSSCWFHFSSLPLTRSLCIGSIFGFAKERVKWIHRMGTRATNIRAFPAI